MNDWDLYEQAMSDDREMEQRLGRNVEINGNGWHCFTCAKTFARSGDCPICLGKLVIAQVVPTAPPPDAALPPNLQAAAEKLKADLSGKNPTIDWGALADAFDPPQTEKPDAALLAALKDIVAVANDSDGITGYHLNGNVAKWDEDGWLSEAEDAIAQAEATDGQ